MKKGNDWDAGLTLCLSHLPCVSRVTNKIISLIGHTESKIIIIIIVMIIINYKYSTIKSYLQLISLKKTI